MKVVVSLTFSFGPNIRVVVSINFDFRAEMKVVVSRLCSARKWQLWFPYTFIFGPKMKVVVSITVYFLFLLFFLGPISSADIEDYDDGNIYWNRTCNFMWYEAIISNYNYYGNYQQKYRKVWWLQVFVSLCYCRDHSVCL